MASPSEKLCSPMPMAIDMPSRRELVAVTGRSATAMAPGPRLWPVIERGPGRSRQNFPTYRSERSPTPNPTTNTAIIENMWPNEAAPSRYWVNASSVGS
jgi:hypothetical protein